ENSSVGGLPSHEIRHSRRHIAGIAAIAATAVTSDTELSLVDTCPGPRGRGLAMVAGGRWGGGG
ncbi:MAG: hypothetical protein ACK56I_22860, partial [bacterium]